jgi:hypothetical protein
MTINLFAVNNFTKGDVGRVAGNAAIKTDARSASSELVVALQDIRAGQSGWFRKGD